MPPGYRYRATDLVHQSQLRVRLLAPIDFVIAKLRCGTDLDFEDATFVAKRIHLTPDRVRAAGAAALAASPQDTALFFLQKTVELSPSLFFSFRENAIQNDRLREGDVANKLGRSIVRCLASAWSNATASSSVHDPQRSSRS
jgi:hypothetical protein